MEYWIFKQSLDFYFGTIIYSIALYLLAIKYPYIEGCSILRYIGQNLSMAVYIVHIAVIEFVAKISEALGGGSLLSWLKPILSIVLSLAIAYIYYKVMHIVEQKNEQKN